MKIERYQAYKDSAVKWLGDVPEHWALQRLKDIAQITRGAILRPVDDPLYFDKNGEWYYLNISDATKCDKFLYTAKLKLSDLGSRKSARVLPDNIILTASATIGKPTINKVKVCVHDGFIPFKQIKCNIFYLYYFLLNSNIYTALGKSNTQKNIYLDEIKTVNIAVPPLTEQKSIAHYLDTKTAQSDRKIDLLTQKAALYGDLKQSLINETVTRGLDKSVPMKDSGIEWLGEVPEHWGLCKLKDITFYQEGPGIMADDFQEKGIPLIRISGMKGKRVSLDGCNYLDPTKVSNKWKHFKLQQGDLLVSASATTGIVAKVSEETIGAIPYTGLIRFKPRRGIALNYLQYFLSASVFINQIELQKSGTTIQHYGPTHLSRVFAILPPLCEQKEIADYLDIKTTKID